MPFLPQYIMIKIWLNPINYFRVLLGLLKIYSVVYTLDYDETSLRLRLVKYRGFTKSRLASNINQDRNIPYVCGIVSDTIFDLTTRCVINGWYYTDMNSYVHYWKEFLSNGEFKRWMGK